METDRHVDRAVRRRDGKKLHDQQPEPLDQHIKRIGSQISQQEKRYAQMGNDQSAEQDQQADQGFLDFGIHVYSPVAKRFPVLYDIKSTLSQGISVRIQNTAGRFPSPDSYVIMYAGQCSVSEKTGGTVMASGREYLDFILEQLSGLENITWKAMMGEYIIYWRGRIVGGIYDDRFLVKPTKSAVAMMPDADRELPYEGAKEMLLVDNVDNREFLAELLTAMYDELPAPKKKK